MPRFASRNRGPAVWLLLISLLVLILATLWHLDPRVGRLWLNSARLASLTCLIALPLGTLLAAAIFKSDVPGRRIAAFCPLCVSRCGCYAVVEDGRLVAIVTQTQMVL